MIDLYLLLVQGDYHSVAEESEVTNYSLCCKVLAYAQLADIQEAEKTLQKIQVSNLTPQERSIFLEGKAVLAFRKGEKKVAYQFAEDAIQLNPPAVIANSLLGRAAESRRHMQEAYRHYAAIVDAYPDYDAALLACSRTLFFTHQNKQAEEYLKKVSQQNEKKSAYNLVATVFYRSIWARAILVVGLLGLLLLPYTYLVLTILIVIGFGLVISRYKGDLFIGNALAIIEIVATVFSLAFTLLRWFFIHS